MAPFNQAHKIKKPLLLIHGEADNNTGPRRRSFACRDEKPASEAASPHGADGGHSAVCAVVLHT